MQKRKAAAESLAIALEVLDRVQGTTVYNLQKRLSGFTDEEYEEALGTIGEIFLLLSPQLPEDYEE